MIVELNHANSADEQTRYFGKSTLFFGKKKQQDEAEGNWLTRGIDLNVANILGEAETKAPRQIEQIAVLVLSDEWFDQLLKLLISCWSDD